MHMAGCRLPPGLSVMRSARQDGLQLSLGSQPTCTGVQLASAPLLLTSAVGQARVPGEAAGTALTAGSESSDGYMGRYVDVL